LLNSRRGSRHEATGEFPFACYPASLSATLSGIADCAIPHFLFNKLKPVFISGMNVGIEPIIGVKGWRNTPGKQPGRSWCADGVWPPL